MNREEALQAELVALRRDFHRHAESKWREFRTASKVARYLLDLGIPVLLGREMAQPGMGFGMLDEETVEAEQRRAVAQGAEPELVARMDGLPGVVGIVDTGRPGPVTAFRFDMDSLPFSEDRGAGHRPAAEGFASINEGCCHACGHDGHTAIGMVVAKELLAMRGSLCGTFKLIFQPGEEGGGGARGIVARGILDDVDYFFAGHIGLTRLNGLPVVSHGLIAGVKDFLDNRRYDIDFHGRAAHPCGDPQNGKNALLAACQAALGIHNIPPNGEGLLRVNAGVLRAGVSRNTIAPFAHLEAEVRGNCDKVAQYGEEKLLAVVRGAAAMYEVDCEAVCIGRTSAGASDDRAIEMVLACAGRIPWFTQIEPEGSVGGTDDASDMLRRVQERGGCGTYFGLGADFTSSFHDPAFDFDESVLEPAVELFCALARAVSELGS